MKIELYLNSERGVVKGTGRKNLPPLTLGTTLSGGADGRKYDSWHVKKAFVGLSEKETRMKERLERIAEQYNAELRVYDVKKASHAFRALFKGVRDTPAIIIGKHKFGEDFKENEILRVLEEN